MGRADDKDGDGLPSEADEEQDKDTSDMDDPDFDVKKQDKETLDIEDPNYDSKKKYKCTEPGCTARFLRPSRLTWHLRKHNDERPYKCDREGCNRAYTNSSHLKRHQNSHTPVTKSYECTECSVIVGSLFSLKRHHRKIHDPTRLTCELCGAKFRKKHCYTEHLSMHAGVTLYDCDGCDQQFSTQRLLKKHQIIHEKLKSYACKSPGCTDIFNQWSKLVKHVETKHEFAHECSKCEKKFKNKAQLSVHEAVHEKRFNPIQCPHENCPRFYTHEKNLEEHIATAHLGRRFICDTCGQQLTSKASIIRHIKNVHEELEKPLQRKKRQFRRRRKDAGKRKRSMATKLAGLKLPHELEKIVLMREPRIILERVAKSTRKDNKEKSSSSLATNKTQIIVENYLEKFSSSPKQIEEGISSSASTMLDTGRLPICENPVEESSKTNEQTNEKILSLGDEQTQNDLGIMREKVLAKSNVVSGEIDKEIELIDVELEQTNEPNVLESNVQETSKSAGKIDGEISVLAKEIMQDDTGPILENFLEKSSVSSGQIDEDIELIEVELEQTNEPNGLESNVQEASKSAGKINSEISVLAEEMVEDDMEIMLDKYSVVSGQIDEEIRLIEVVLEQTNEPNVLESNNVQEAPKSAGKIDSEISVLAEEMVEDDMEIMLEKSSVVAGEIDEEIRLIEVVLEQTNEPNVLESNVQESSKTAGEIDREISILAEEMVEDDTRPILENFIETSSVSSGEKDEDIELIEVELEQTNELNVLENNFQESPESPGEIDRGLSFPVDETVQDETEMFLDKFLGNSPFSLPEVEKGVSILVVHRVQTRGDPRRQSVWASKIVKNRLEESSNEPERMDVDVSSLADNLFENDSSGKTNEKISMLEANQMQTDRFNNFDNNLQARSDTPPKIVWDLKLVEKHVKNVLMCLNK